MSKTSITLNPLVKEAIRDAVNKALKAKPILVNSAGGKWEGYEMDGEIWMSIGAAEHILSEYSWWK